jgi:ABC-2 type transport system permease protein
MKRLYWLVRRELWESRAIWFVPLACALIIAGGTLIASFGHGVLVVDGHATGFVDRLNSALTPGKAQAVVSTTLGAIALPFFITILLTQFFYSLDALYGERRDRSVLFWKSLPVSDAETVLAKLLVAGLLIPVVAALAALATQLLVCGIASATLASAPVLVSQLWSPAVWAGSLLVMGYVLVAGILWYLPLVGWLLLVSASVPRAPFLWAFLPPLALSLAEYVAFRTSYLFGVVGERFGNTGLFAHAFRHVHGTGFAIVVEEGRLELPRALTELMRPAEFLGSASVWAGIVVGIGCVAAAIWMRRYRDATA